MRRNTFSSCKSEAGQQCRWGMAGGKNKSAEFISCFLVCCGFMLFVGNIVFQEFFIHPLPLSPPPPQLLYSKLILLLSPLTGLVSEHSSWIIYYWWENSHMFCEGRCFNEWMNVILFPSSGPFNYITYWRQHNRNWQQSKVLICFRKPVFVTMQGNGLPAVYEFVSNFRETINTQLILNNNLFTTGMPSSPVVTHPPTLWGNTNWMLHKYYNIK